MTQHKVSIVIPLFNPNRQVLNQLVKRLKEQTIKAEVIFEDNGMPEHKALNQGISKSNGDIIVTLDQDCVPSGNLWLENLIAPFEDNEVVATAPSIEFPYEVWKNLSFLNKLLTAKEQMELHNTMDERGCAYRKEILKKIGGFNESRVTVLGDMDTYFKLVKYGKVAYPKNCKVYHIHPVYGFSKLKKEYSYSRGVGISFKIFGLKDYTWWKRVIKMIPLAGAVAMCIRFPKRKHLIMFFFYVLFSPIFQMIHIVAVFDGIIRGDK